MHDHRIHHDHFLYNVEEVMKPPTSSLAEAHHKAEELLNHVQRKVAPYYRDGDRGNGYTHMEDHLFGLINMLRIMRIEADEKGKKV
jgi:hypothetical protein